MTCRSSPRKQRGFVSVVAAILLVAGVLFILGQSYGVIGSRSVDTSQHLDSTAALMLAESGLQRAEAVVTNTSSGWTDANCTAFSGTGPYALGRGSFHFGTAVSTPASCGAAGGTICTGCTISATGTVGSASRTLSRLMSLATVNGTTGRGQTVTMVLGNTHAVPAVALFNLAWQRQSAGGNADASICSNGAIGCGNVWNVESSSGNNSVGGMGVTVDIAALTLSKVVTQNISQPRYYAEVGGLFPGTGAAPVTLGSFWKDTGSAGAQTVNNAGSNPSSGETNSGVATSSGTCVSSPNTYPTGGGGGSEQTCTNWCRDATGVADTLVFGVSGRSASVADEIGPVVFNTNGANPQNVALSRVVHFPNTDGSIANASGEIYAEIWKAYNPAYLFQPASGGLGATTYPTQLQATVGSQFNAANIASGATSMSVTSFISADSRICIGDAIAATSNPNRFQSNTSVTTTPQNPTGSAGGLQCSNQTGTYAFDKATTNTMNTPTVGATSSKLVVKNIMGTLTLNTALQQNGVNTTLVPTAAVATDANVWSLSTPAARTLATYTQGSNGTTVTLPVGSPLPLAGTRLAVFSGSGQLVANTTVASASGSTITLSQAPAAGLANASICGGVCAFFNDPASTTSKTQFQVTKVGGTTQWSGGFVCLRGVDDSLVAPVTSTSATPRNWQEKVQ